jgi:hypothetical protein
MANCPKCGQVRVRLEDGSCDCGCVYDDSDNYAGFGIIEPYPSLDWSEEK